MPIYFLIFKVRKVINTRQWYVELTHSFLASFGIHLSRTDCQNRISSCVSYFLGIEEQPNLMNSGELLHSLLEEQQQQVVHMFDDACHILIWTLLDIIIMIKFY